MRSHLLSTLSDLDIPGNTTPPAPGGLAVWWIVAPPDVSPTDPIRAPLSDAECLRARRFLEPVSRAEFILGRTLVRSLFARWLDLEPAAVPIRLTPAGRPWIDAGAGGWDFDFSLAHSHGLVALAVTRQGRVGMDVERCTDPGGSWRDLAPSVLHPTETATLASRPEAEQWRGFLRAWVAKEAILKALGQGLLADPTTLVLSLPTEPSSPTRISRLPEGRPIQDWDLRSWDPRTGWLGAIAIAHGPLPDG